MDFTKPGNDDPHGVQRLLSILRAQQDASSASSSTNASAGVATSRPIQGSVPAVSSGQGYANPFLPDQSLDQREQQHSEAETFQTRITRRLYDSNPRFGSQYQPEEQQEYDPYSFNPFSADDSNTASTTRSTDTVASSEAESRAPQDKPKELSELTFAESLPILSSLSGDHTFLSSLRSLIKKQEDLERSLLKQYRAQSTRKPSQLDTDMTPNEKTREYTLTRSLLQQWDHLISDQQRQLQHLGIPTFKVTRDPPVVSRQKKVLHVLIAMLDD
ncbi:hypothetical protein BCV70DRAFT_201007 [Testicularia cyperi]|uniref:Uncharacterized protein n=1 Tax=Testicularia cyperi TaxID=1882483 RepID=A0A317XMY9_9BASI|nr:hypothetical protein BCV70DRAFT_201007 [Testicularia cyperi]